MQRSNNRRLVLILLLALTAVTTAAALVTIVGPLVRYSYTENTVYGYTVRSDRITGDKCLLDGGREFTKILALRRCDVSG